MTFELAKSPPDFHVMQFGGESGTASGAAAAEELVRACGGAVALGPSGIEALAAALKQGQRCLVLWSDPQEAVAAALRQGQPLAEAVEGWRQTIEPVLRLFRRYRRRMVLVDALLVTRGPAAEIANLAAALSLTMAPAPEQTMPEPDLARAIADLVVREMAAPGSELASLLDELLAASLGLARRSIASGAVRDLVAAYTVTARGAPDTEAGLLRTAMSDIADALSSAQARGADALHKAAYEPARAETLMQEVKLLRAQLVSVSEDGSSTATAADSDNRRPADLGAENALLRAQIGTLTDLLATSQRHRQAAGSGLSPAETARAVALLHEQLTAMQHLLDDSVRRSASASAAHPRAEAAIAVLLADNIAELGRRLRLENELLAAQKSLRVLQADRTAAAYRLI